VASDIRHQNTTHW